MDLVCGHGTELKGTVEDGLHVCPINDPRFDCVPLTCPGRVVPFPNLRTITCGQFVLIRSVFSHCHHLVELTMGNNCTVKRNAFRDCPALRCVSFGYGARIETSAFLGCGALQTLVLGHSCTVEERAFTECAHLRTISPLVDAVIGHHAFAGTALASVNVTGTTAHHAFADTALKSVDVAGTVGASAFAGTPLVSVNITGLTQIGEYAFAQCTALLAVTGGHHVETVGESAFWGCKRLTVANLPEIVTIEPHAFRHCNALRAVDLSRVRWIGTGAFQHCTHLVDIRWPRGSLTVRSSAFSGCTRLASVVLPPGAVVHVEAFTRCDALYSVHIPVGAVAMESFRHCPFLTVATVESEAAPPFRGCNLLYVAAKDTCGGLYRPLTDATRRRAAGLTLCSHSTLKQVFSRLPPAGRARLLLVLCIAERLKHTTLALPAEMWFAITACYTVPELCAEPAQ
jgi:hypothetical protein